MPTVTTAASAEQALASSQGCPQPQSVQPTHSRGCGGPVPQRRSYIQPERWDRPEGVCQQAGVPYEVSLSVQYPEARPETKMVLGNRP